VRPLRSARSAAATPMQVRDHGVHALSYAAAVPGWRVSTSIALTERTERDQGEA
jgi:hypothetical protein